VRMSAYTCGACGRTFQRPPKERWNPEAEASELFVGGVLAMPEPVEVCDDCWPEFLAWMNERYGPPPWPAGRPA